jgi:hypothetical protein
MENRDTRSGTLKRRKEIKMGVNELVTYPYVVSIGRACLSRKLSSGRFRCQERVVGGGHDGGTEEGQNVEKAVKGWEWLTGGHVLTPLP